jgi:predicted metal-binding membrane protein
LDRRLFFGVATLLFVISAAVTIVWCGSMPASMVWMRMPGQTWLAAAASFLGMWVLMMIAMMLPSLTPTLWREHQSVSGTMVVGTGYFFVWAVIGLAVYPIGVAMAALELPRTIALAVVIALAFVIQCATWRARRPTFPMDGRTHWRHGLRLGLGCVSCCAGLMAVLLVVGATDLRAMALVTVAITVVRSRDDARSRTGSYFERHITQGTDRWRTKT